MALLKCPTCKTENVRATYICEPCHNPAGNGKTAWTVIPVPEYENTNKPPPQQCPGCMTDRGPALLTCLNPKCGHSWVSNAKGAMPRGKGIAKPKSVKDIQK